MVAAALGRPARLLPFPPSLMRFAGKLLGKSGAVDRIVSSLTIDSSKIRWELGWKPPYAMVQGLKETAEWFGKAGEEGGVRRWEVPKIGIWDDIGNVEFDGDEVR